VIGAGSRIGARVRIHPHVTVYPGVEIGEDSEIHSGAHLREGTRIGKRVVLNNGVVIGAPGFGFTTRADGKRVRVPHVCPVEIGDDCEIGANTTIDASHPGHARRGHPDVRTRIGVGVIMDNGVQIAHGCEIGDHSTLCAHVALAGSTVVGRYVFMGGMAASAGHLTIGDLSMVGAMAAPASDVAPGSQVLGAPRRSDGLGKILAATAPAGAARVRRIEKRPGLSARSDHARLAVASGAATRLGVLEARAARAGYARIAGVDEVGIGPLAGPVTAAVVLPPGATCAA
jgi:UDP-3-O-[3-hydroxymyristoyl] glucosamine N-acyltransferase LpxD